MIAILGLNNRFYTSVPKTIAEALDWCDVNGPLVYPESLLIVVMDDDDRITEHITSWSQSDDL